MEHRPFCAEGVFCHCAGEFPKLSVHLLLTNAATDQATETNRAKHIPFRQAIFRQGASQSRLISRHQTTSNRLALCSRVRFMFARRMLHHCLDLRGASDGNQKRAPNEQELGTCKSFTRASQQSLTCPITAMLFPDPCRTHRTANCVQSVGW